MAMFYCELCGMVHDGDWIESYEWDKGEVCIDCHTEATPEDWEDWEVYCDQSAPKFARWQITHKDYDGAPAHSFGPPADPRHFFAPTLEEAWQEVIEWQESDPPDSMDDGDWAYDNWKDKQLDKRK